MNTEIIITFWQQFKGGKVVKTTKMDLITTKAKLNEIAKQIAKDENISIKEIYFIYKEKI